MNNYKLFESYIFNKLSAEDKRNLEEKLTTDATFKSDLLSHIKMQRSLDHLLDIDLLKTINDLDKNTVLKERNIGQSKSRKLKILISTAAMLLLLVSAYFYSIQPTNTDKLYAEYFGNQLTSSVRAQTQDLDQDQSEVFVLNTIEEAKLFLSKQDYKQTVTVLKDALLKTDITQQDYIRWYLAGAYLKLDVEKSKEQLMWLKSNANQSWIKSDAEELLAALEH